MDRLCILIKVVIILALILIFYKLYKKNITELEGFDNINYLKLNETYIEPEGTNLDILYANYSGEEINNDIWKNKTLEQCTDLCTQLEGCAGFARKSNVNDTASADCLPRSNIGTCHSVRKGNNIQMQNAIKYNSFIKSNSNKYKKSSDNKILNKCIGDPNMTLKRAVFIKSQMFPTKYIGTMGDGIAMLIEKNSPDFDTQCRFRIEVGQDGIGTVSFFHIYSNKYLCRMKTNANDIYEFIGLKDISKGGTEDKQRASFNILDSMKNLMKFKSLPIDGENVDKFIAINNDNNNYLVCSQVETLPTEQLFTFNIVDQIVSSNIINDKNKIISENSNGENEVKRENEVEGEKEVKREKEKFETQVDAIGNKIISNNITAITFPLDNSSNIPLFKNVFATPTNLDIKNYLNDNYSSQFNKYTTIDKKVNDIKLRQQLSNSITKNQDTFNSLYQLNQEIEKEIAGLNMDLNAKNDNVIHNIDRMKITDMANDYYSLQNVYPYALDA